MSALITEKLKKKYNEEVPYDYSNPAVSTEKLKKQMCVKCNLMFAAINMKKTHQKDIAAELSAEHGTPFLWGNRDLFGSPMIDSVILS